MKKTKPFRFRRTATFFVSLLFCLSLYQSERSPALAVTASSTAKTKASFVQLPLSFEANRGQADGQIKFLSRGQGYTLLLTPNEAVLELRKVDFRTREENPMGDAPNSQNPRSEIRLPQSPSSATVRMKLAGANPQPHISGMEPSPGKANYFIGNDERHWQTDVPTYRKVRYEAVYPGIDLVYYGKQQQLEYDFIVAPGGDARRIKLRFAGARRLHPDARGDLLLDTKGGLIRQHRPFAYQEIDGHRREIACRYRISSNEVTFVVGQYDAGKPLIIDPVLSYSTYLGGALGDVGDAIAVDAAGNIYVTGRTALQFGKPPAFPTTPGAVMVVHDSRAPAEGMYIFVAKLNPAGALIYSAIIGGNQGFFDRTLANPYLPPENYGRGITVDNTGNAYLTGTTLTLNFPATSGVTQSQSYSTLQKGVIETFVLKLSPQGDRLIYSTLLGQGETASQAIAVNPAGQAWITGSTASRLFPTTANALQQTPYTPNATVFVSQLNATATQLVYSSLLSSGSGETAAGIAIDKQDAVYVTGWTSSSCARADVPPVEPFPTTEGAYRRDTGQGCVSPGENRLVFVTKFKADGTLGFSTLLGAGLGGRIAVDATGNAFVAGMATKGSGFPITPGALQSEIIGAPTTQAAFITKLNAQGSALAYSTYINGAAGEPYDGPSLAVDAAGNACIAGTVSANTFVRTTTEKPFLATGGVFVTKINPAGSAFVYSVVIGEGLGRGIVTDARGDVFITGETKSDKFPVTSNAFQQRLGNLPGAGTDAFVSRISEASVTQPFSNVSAASYTGSTVASDSIIAAFGSGLATATQVATANPLPTALAGTTVKVHDSAGIERAASLFFVSPTQVNYLMPAGTASGAATINITSGNGAVSTASVLIESVAPGLFAADASGRGLAAAIALRVKANGEQSYEPIARYDAALSRMMPMPVNLASENEQVFLILYGTGLRHNAGLGNVGVKIGGVDAEALYAGAQGGFFGVDQVNVRLPRTLTGRGESDIVLSVDGKTANTVKVWIK